MHLVLFLVLSSLAVAYGLPRNLRSISSIEELGGLENRPDVSQALVPICVRGDDYDNADDHVFERLHCLTARDPLPDVLAQRSGAKGSITSTSSRTSTNISPSPPRTSIRPPSPSSAQSQPLSGTRARGHHATANHTTSVATGNSALGVTAPSASEPPMPAATTQHSRISGYKSHRISQKAIIVVCVLGLLLVVAVIVGLLLWRRKMAQKN
ncbi:hypothetical protein LXA43DRAFT_718774 [Ganoderma leucocontextum]|nr:hypothetical protein LXA43DRAFT_52440 [Ganoderma leucocontextum]KAI1787308.1 hypothetical protein LXA43DRAFT_718774 [Ganoderma leucocontextum]